MDIGIKDSQKVSFRPKNLRRTGGLTHHIMLGLDMLISKEGLLIRKQKRADFGSEL